MKKCLSVLVAFILVVTQFTFLKFGGRNLNNMNLDPFYILKVQK